MADDFSHLDRAPRGITAGPWVRRALLGLMLVVVVLALLDRFGQAMSESSVRTPAALMRLSAPETVRGGLFFESRLEIRALRDIEHPRVVLDDGWIEGMQVNSIEPSPVSEASRDGRVVLSYDALSAGDVLRVWFQFQVIPTTAGRRSYGVELDDADTPIARLAPSITVLP
jgi:hypothetical protein